MVPPTPTPSSRLMRAAAAERADLARHRERLLVARERLLAELAAVETSLRELAERDALLDRLAGDAYAPAAGAPGGRAPTSAASPASVAPASTRRDRDRVAGPARVAPLAGGAGAAAERRAHDTAAHVGCSDAAAGPAVTDTAPSTDGPRTAAAPDTARHADSPGAATTLRGPAIRRTAVEVLRTLPGGPQALHYRTWFDALRAAGFGVAGKDPLAVFLTQLSRSPAVRRGTQSGVYELDLGAPARLRARLEALHAELRRLTGAPTATTDLTAIRARRAAITTQITQVEKALEEAEAVLAPIAGDGAPVAATA